MIQINQIRLKPDHSEEDLNNRIRRKLRLSPGTQFTYSILRRSLDARKKPGLFYVYCVLVKTDHENQILRRLSKDRDITAFAEKPYRFPACEILPVSQTGRPVVAGSGPAGLFCALMLAGAGLRPIIVERGADVDTRSEKVERFWQDGLLDLNTNVQFGEGGAGTFSDGKLNTSIHDPSGRIRFVLETFVRHGADPEILWSSKPHIGTDCLKKIIKNIRKEIISLGGTYSFCTALTDLEPARDLPGSANRWRVHLAVREKDEVRMQICETPALILAIGHSARDTYEMLCRRGFTLQQKAFAIGVRIQHPQKWIDRAMYGDPCVYELPPASYKLTYKAADGRGVYSFCMCPGGYVVNASSEKGRLAVNGMSYHDRAGENANSAIVVTVSPEQYDPQRSAGVLGGIEWQRMLEEKAYTVGEGKIPLQRFRDFRQNKDTCDGSPADIAPAVRGAWCSADVRSIFPDDIAKDLTEAILAFEKQIPGFSSDDAIIAGVESRTSSPVRILRTQDGEAEGFPGIYPCGEGAGYAGGITSAAVDGIRIAEYVCMALKKAGKVQ